jgi:putative pyruvate formate lyase activating enzyme
MLCPRLCRVDRTAGQRGVCAETAVCRVASSGPHHGEEPALSGTRGSGTIFFTGCSCRCLFCQNWQISREGLGEGIGIEDLTARALDLAARGVHNLNFVTPTHFWPHIRELCRRLRAAGVRIPFILNCSGYERPEMVQEYREVIDIYLPDFKFADPALARRCMGDPQYPDCALAAVREMVAAAGFLEPWDDTFRTVARRGVLVRHLVLPGQVRNSLGVLHLLHRHFGPDLPLSIMSQYRPMPACLKAGFLTEPVPRSEYEQVCALAEELGFGHAFIQPNYGDESFAPDFHQEEPFAGNRRADGHPLLETGAGGGTNGSERL